jgi:peptidoglycan/xylan/chitin deacetylase (PgdA/CDA1 family)
MHALPGARRVRRLGRAAAGALRRRAPRGVVLLYHRVAGPRRDPQTLDVPAGRFDTQLAALARSSAPIPLDEFEARRRAGTLPPRAVAVTFDDGYADNLLAAAPILARHRVPATVFVTAGMVDANREFWWDDAERIAFAPGPLGANVPQLDEPWSEADGAAGALDGAHDRWTLLDRVDPTPRHRLYRAMCAALHALSATARDARLAAWRAWAGIPEAARASHRVLTLEELRALAGSSGITIGAHTMTHPVLARLAPLEQHRELEESRLWLSRALGRPVDAAAYPFGTRAEVSRETTHAARDAGFDYAMANEPAAAWRWSSRWRVPRVLVRDWDAETFARRLDGWFAA